MPCLVDTGRGFSLSYKGRFLYSKYAPDKAVVQAVKSLRLLPGTLIVASSPCLWYGLSELEEILPPKCFILALEADKNLYEFAKAEFDKIQREKAYKNVLLLPPEEISNLTQLILHSGRYENSDFPQVFDFKRAIYFDFSGGSAFFKDFYLQAAAAAEEAISSFWKNRLTLIKFGRLYARNLFKNLRFSSIYDDFAGRLLDLKYLLHTVEKPILIFGAGESAEESVADLKGLKQNDFFILAVDAALPFLRTCGVKVDGLVALESQLAIQKAYIGNLEEDFILFADLCSRPAVARQAGKYLSFFMSDYAPAKYLKGLVQKEILPPILPPLGSVGLAAVFLALNLRRDSSVPVFFTGMDFSFSAGKSHAKGSPHNLARLIASDRLNPAEVYSFGDNIFPATGKGGKFVYTAKNLAGYAAQFARTFAGSRNLFDLGKSGLDLGFPAASLQSVSDCKGRGALAGGNENTETLKAATRLWRGTPEKQRNDRICGYFENELSMLRYVKALLINGKSAQKDKSLDLSDEIASILAPRDYLYLHFPDGYAPNFGDLGFLKRVRSEIDFFIKDFQ